MIAHRTSGASLCLRCELQALRSRAPRSCPRRSSHRSLSTSTSRRNDFDDNGDPKPSKTGDYANTHSPTRLSRFPLRRVVRLEGMKALGSDAGVIVLPELLSRKPRSFPTETVEAADVGPEQERPDILATLKTEGAAATQDEINQQLDSLRPTPDMHVDTDGVVYISHAEERTLKQTLMDGFNGQQLSKYLRSLQKKHRQKQQKGSRSTAGEQKSSARPVPRTQWTPISQVTSGWLAENNPPQKSKVVDEILRMWDIFILEEVESPGRIELTLQPWQLPLLTVGAPSTVLSRVGNLRKAKVEVLQKPLRVQITAAKSNAEYAADDIERVVQNVAGHQFRISEWAEAGLLDTEKLGKKLGEKLVDIFPAGSLQAVGDINGAYIQPVSDDTLSIHASDEESANAARRDLVRLLPLKGGPKCTVRITMAMALKKKGSFMPCAFQDHLAYTERAQALGRWVLPSLRQDVDQQPGEEPHTPPASLSGNSLNPVNPVNVSVQTNMVSEVASPETPATNGNGTVPGEELGRDTAASISESTVPTSEARTDAPPVVSSDPVPEVPAVSAEEVAPNVPQWRREPRVTLSAVFGHAMYPMNNHRLPNLKDRHATTAVFSTALPGIYKVLRNTLDPIVTETLDYSFVPSPRTQIPLEPGQTYPELAMKFRPRPRTAELRSVTLSHDRYCHDVLLPDNLTDIRFKHEKQISLLNFRLHPAIKEYAKEVVQSFKSRGRLTAPPEITIEVPRFTIAGNSPTDESTVPVTYLFAGVSHRQHFNASYKGHQLVYHSVNEGKMGRNGTSLQLYSTKGTSDIMKEVDFAEHKERLAKFVHTAFSLVGDLTRAGGDPLTLRTYAKTVPVTDYLAEEERRKDAEALAGLEKLNDADLSTMLGDVLRPYLDRAPDDLESTDMD
ncbi:hypothetical protein M011DRAFT_159351 [Sporormia fimetaria CBS 119925]|uniref:Uncharacterized protein n=1 Tax=Sporormia fimetaria CBS 119925 TaxID=1340428 RepID=A0A6A6V6D7_9PLEO|nr:hypothetical protein M011DRAFT_159351 [Sporormia fimetaria CBS 119925]